VLNEEQGSCDEEKAPEVRAQAVREVCENPQAARERDTLHRLNAQNFLALALLATNPKFYFIQNL